MKELLRILQENAKQPPEDIAKMLDWTVDEVTQKISELEAGGIILGYRAIVDEEKADPHAVTAVIEVKITPERTEGFNHIAQRISRFDEVQSLYLTSGDFDLLLFVTGKNLKEVAGFVSARLSLIDGVISTATHFMLKVYKEHGVLMEKENEYERLKVSP